jgi:amidophosphoribosyltransferase
MCGIVGIISRKNQDYMGALAHLGLGQMMNRGDHSAGIASIRKLPIDRKTHKMNRILSVEHGISEFNPLRVKKAESNVKDVFKRKEDLEALSGYMCIGHVRYPTAGYTITEEDRNMSPEEHEKKRTASIQPLVAPYHNIVMVHNGDVHNYHEIMQSFRERHVPKSGYNDLEAILKTYVNAFFSLSENIPDSSRVRDAVAEVMKNVKGTYNVLTMMNNVGLIAFKDPEGRRPLFYGVKRDDEGEIYEYAFASETVALEKMFFKGTKESKYENGWQAYDEIGPGEMMLITKDFEVHREQIASPDHKPCLFEVAYFMKASSHFNDRRVRKLRQDLIDTMWEEFKTYDTYRRVIANKEDTVIVPIPRTAETVGDHLHKLTGIPLEAAVEKNVGAPRIFMQPTQIHREKDTTTEHYVYQEYVRGKNLIVIDDSIVRGTTMKHLIKYFRDCGAKDIHLFVTFPPIRNPCMHAIDFHTSEELWAHGKTIPEIKSSLGLGENDSLIYAKPEYLLQVTGMKRQCDECFRA